MNFLANLVRILEHPMNKERKVNTFLKILWWKINQLIFKHPAIIEIFPGIKCICYPDSSFGGWVVYSTLPEFSEMNFFYNFVGKAGTLVDVGASIGVYSLIAGSRISKGAVYAFEPSHDARNKLTENIHLNKLKNVYVYDFVVSDKVGEEKFLTGKISEIDHIYDGKSDENKLLVKKKSVTLDSFLEKKKVDRVDVVKIDVEGAEMKVFLGLKKYLEQGKIGVILFEVNRKNKNFGFSTHQTFEYLKSFGFILYNFTGNGQLKKLKKANYEGMKTFNVLAVNAKSKSNLKRIKEYVN